MTYKGAIDEVISLANNSLMPVIFKPSLKKIAETLEMERPKGEWTIKRLDPTDKNYPTIPMKLVDNPEQYDILDIDGLRVIPLVQVMHKLMSIEPDAVIRKGVRYESRPKGEWIADVDKWGDVVTTVNGYTCSKCGTFNSDKDNFCPNCGADMRGAKNENQKL